MADIKISQMTDGGEVQDADTLPAVRSGANVKVNIAGKANKNAGLNPQTDDYILALSDNGKIIEMDKATEVFVEVLEDGDVDFPEGAQILFKQVGAGKITFVHPTAVQIDTPETLSSAKQNAIIGIYKNDDNHWTAFGNLEAA